MKKYIVILLIGIFATFQLNAHVELVYPQGGETFNQGEKVTIEWQIVVEHNTRDWDLYYSEDGGSIWNPIQLDMHVGTLSYQWIVPNIKTERGRIRIVQDNSDIDYDNISQDFTITATTFIEKQTNTGAIKVYPNPLISSATLSFPNPENESHTLILYDAQGHIERRIDHIIMDKLIIRRENLKSGLYVFHMYNDNGFSYIGELIVQ